jgi:hypothetical protein
MGKKERLLARQIENAFKKGRLLFASCFLFALGDWESNFDLSTINKDNGLLKKPTAFTSRKRSSSSKSRYEMQEESPPNLLKNLLAAANKMGEDRYSHVKKYLAALRALLDSYEKRDEITPNKKTRFYRELKLVYTRLLAIHTSNTKHLPLAEAYAAFHRAPEEPEFNQGTSTEIEIVVANDLLLNDNEDDEPEPVSTYSTKQSVVWMESKQLKLPKKAVVDVTDESVKSIMLGVLSAFLDLYLVEQSISEIVKNDFAHHLGVALAFVLQKMLMCLDAVVCLSLVPLLFSAGHFPPVIAKAFPENLAQLDKKMAKRNVKSAQKILLSKRNIPSNKYSEEIANAKKEAECWKGLLQYENINWIIMHDVLNLSVVMGQGGYKSAESLALSAALNMYCAATLRTTWWQWLRLTPWARAENKRQKQRQHLLAGYLNQLLEVQTYQNLADLSVFDDSTEDEVSQGYLKALNSYVATLQQKINKLTNAVYDKHPKEEDIWSALEVLGISRSVIVSLYREENLEKDKADMMSSQLFLTIAHYFDENSVVTVDLTNKRSSVSSRQQTNTWTQGEFMNIATRYFLQDLQQVKGYRQYVKDILGSQPKKASAIQTEEIISSSSRDLMEVSLL